MTMRFTFYITTVLSADPTYYLLDLMFDFVDYVSNRIRNVYYAIDRWRKGFDFRNAEQIILVQLVCSESIN